MTIITGPEVGVVRALESRNLFRFQPEVERAIEPFVEATEAAFSNLDPAYLTRVREQTHLAAAEFALMPGLTEPGAINVAVDPVEVDQGHAALAILKWDCQLITGCFGADAFGPADLTVFSGDTSKFGALDGDWPRLISDPQELHNFVRTLEAAHEEHRAPLVNAVGASGVLRLQGLIWRLRLTVAGMPGYPGPLDAALDDSRRALDLT